MCVQDADLACWDGLSRWNSPVILGARSIATPVAAGCTVVFKASEACPKTHHLLVEVFKKAGLPDGVINVIQTRREEAAAVTEALVAHPAIRKVEFVGSAAVGKAIGQLGGKYLKPVLMELGGKGPAIVLADADLKGAAEKCVAGGEYFILYVTSQEGRESPRLMYRVATRYSLPPPRPALLLHRESHCD